MFISSPAAISSLSLRLPSFDAVHTVFEQEAGTEHRPRPAHSQFHQSAPSIFLYLESRSPRIYSVVKASVPVGSRDPKLQKPSGQQVGYRRRKKMVLGK